MRVNRIIIYPKDVQLITGRSERYGRLLLKRIKDRLGKEDHQFITIDEFSTYTGIKIEQVAALLTA